MSNQPFPTPSIVSSTKFVESLDRSFLGVFAVPERMLILADHIERHAVFQTINMGDFYNSDLNAKVYLLQDELRRLIRDEDVKYALVIAELRWWWDFVGDPVGRAVPARGYFFGDGSYQASEQECIEGYRRVDDIYANEAHYEFYVRGIWDNKLIAQYIADGIDAELASRL